MKLHQYAIRVRFGGTELRYSNDRVVIVETDESGADYPVTFVPYLMEFSPFGSSIDIESKFPIPTSSLRIADADGLLADLFDDADVEAGNATVYALDIQGNILNEVDGYLTDYKRDKGVVSCTFIVNDDKSDAGVLEVFSESSFQWFDIFNPFDVSVTPAFDLVPEVPWRVLVASLRRANLDYQAWEYFDNSKGSYEGQNPIGGTPGGSTTGYIKLNIQGDDGNTYLDYDFVFGFFIKVADTNITAADDFHIDYDGTLYSSTDATRSGGTTRADVLEDFESQMTTGGVTVYFDEVKERLWVEGVYGDLNLDPYDGIDGSTFSDDALALYFDPDAVTGTSVPQERRSTLFPDPDGNSYALVVLGNSEYQGTTELVAYSDCKKGQVRLYDGSLQDTLDDNWYISGIPSVHNENPTGDFADITALDASIATEAEFRQTYGIKNKHRAYETVAPKGAHEVVYIDTGGLVPSSLDDPKLGVGFLSFGASFDIPNQNDSLIRFHRYKAVQFHNNVIDPRFDGTVVDTVMKVEIHNRNIDDSHDYAANQLQGSFEVPRSFLVEDQSVFLAEWSSVLTSIDVRLTGLSARAKDLLSSTSKRESLRDRFKGYRVSMVADVELLREVVSEQVTAFNDETDVQQEAAFNAAILNNTDGLFAVCVGSEINEDATNGGFIETLFFYNRFKNDSANPQFILEEEFEGTVEPDTPGETAAIVREGSQDILYTNYFIYDPDIANAQDQQGEQIFNLGDEFFLRGTFKVLHDPVPQNKADIGRSFPIVYGFVKRAPMLHVVSKRPVKGMDITSGDDIYIFASHRCDVSSPNDIIVEIDGGDKLNTKQTDVSQYSLNLQPHIVKSPFPTEITNHYEAVEQENAISQNVEAFVSSRKTLRNPYHKLVRKETRTGFEVNGIQLRGGEWDSRLGKMDKRYAIRNGLGDTQLYASFGGHVSKDGELIRHPVDVFIHFVRTYGKWPYNEKFLDLDNLYKIKSRTRHYTVSVFIDSQISMPQFIERLFRNCGLFPYLNNGAVNLSYIDMDFVDYSNPIADGLNLLEGVREEDKFLKNIYDRIIYRYDYNYPLGKFDGVIDLNSSNNVYCAGASKAKGAKSTYEIQAFWVTDQRMASEIAFLFSKLLSQKRREYNLRVLDVEGINFSPGQVVPLLAPSLSSEQIPVVVLDVKPQKDVLELRVLRLG